MHSTSYILYDIIQKEGEDKLESTPIIYAPDEKLHHKLGEPILLDTEGKDIKWCEEKNSHQIEILLEEKQILEDDIKSFGKGTKWEKQLDYVRNTLAHFSNWYQDNQLDHYYQLQYLLQNTLYLSDVLLKYFLKAILDDQRQVICNYLSLF